MIELMASVQDLQGIADCDILKYIISEFGSGRFIFCNVVLKQFLVTHLYNNMFHGIMSNIYNV